MPWSGRFNCTINDAVYSLRIQRFFWSIFSFNMQYGHLKLPWVSSSVMVVGINLPQHGQLTPRICCDVPPETAFSSSSVRVYSFVSLFLLSMFVCPFFILNICFVIRQSRRDFFSAYSFTEEAFGGVDSELVSRESPMLWRDSLRCRVQNRCNCRTCGCFISAFRIAKRSKL